MPKARPLPPTGAKPLAELPFFALRRVNGGHFDPVVRQLYAAVKEAGGRPAGKGKDGYQFRIGTVEASVNLSTGLAKISAPPVKKRVRNRRSRGKALPGRETAPFEPDFYIDPVLRHEDLVWTIEALPESGDRRVYDINAAIPILQDVGRQFRHAVRQILQDSAVSLYVRMTATTGFEEVYSDAIPDCCLDWNAMRLLLSDGRWAEQTMFTTALGRVRRLAGNGQPQEDDAQFCRRIGRAILDAFPNRAWGASQVISLMRELAPSLSERVCQTIFTELRNTLPETSQWRTGARPPTQSFREAVLPVLAERGLIPLDEVPPPDDGESSWR